MKGSSRSARILMGLVRTYQLLLSAWIGQGCRFEPTCSAYAMQALERHGALKGSYLAVGRICRCHPGCAGGHDPVPETIAGGPLGSNPFFNFLMGKTSSTTDQTQDRAQMPKTSTPTHE